MENGPSINAFAKLFVYHYDNRHHMGMSGDCALVIGPQIVFQILTELQHHYATDGEFRFADFLVVNVVNDLGIVRQMGIGRVR